MSAALASFSHPLTRKLDSIAHLTPGDILALEGLPTNSRALEAGHDIVCQGERPTQCCIMLEGWAYSFREMEDGTRQITGLYLPGDVPDLQSLYVSEMPHTLTTLTPARVAVVSHDTLLDLMAHAPSVTASLWRATLVEAATAREWIVSLGRRSAVERLAHLICELFLRLEAIGMAQIIGAERTMPFPFTQAKLSDAIGVSNVHMNRSLQEVRSDGLIRDGRGWLTVLDWQRLQALANFAPGYLSLRRQTGSEKSRAAS